MFLILKRIILSLISNSRYISRTNKPNKPDQATVPDSFTRQHGITFHADRRSDKNSEEEFYKLKYCSTVVYMVPRA